MLRKNPFYLKVLPPEAPFCNRVRELKELENYGYSGTSVVIYSPRREGKTSLVNRVQERLHKSGAVTVKADFLSVFSVEDIAARLAKAVFSETKKHEPLYRKAVSLIKSFRPAVQTDPLTGSVSLTLLSVSGKTGFELLEDVLESLKIFSQSAGSPLNIFIDEFQEVTSLRDSAKIEALLRTYMQETSASFFFVGSRRRILSDMFNERKRPFYRMAMNYSLEKIAENELSHWIKEQFENSGVVCESELASELVRLAHRHTFYVQKLGMLTFNLSDKAVTKESLIAAYQDLLESEKTVFEESYLKPLASAQRNLLTALARENTKQPFAQDYIRRHSLPSAATLQSALKALLNEDLVHRDADIYTLVDKVFEDYLRRNYS